MVTEVVIHYEQGLEAMFEKEKHQYINEATQEDENHQETNARKVHYSVSHNENKLQQMGMNKARK